MSKIRSLCDKAYIKVWSAKKFSDSNYQCQVTISRKNENKTEDYPDDYITDFSGYVTFRNDAARKIANMGIPEFSKRGSNSKPVEVRLASAPTVRGGGFNSKEMKEYKEIISICDKLPPEDRDKVVKYIKSRSGKYSFTIWDIELPDENSSTSNQTSKKSVVVEDDDEDLPF